MPVLWEQHPHHECAEMGRSQADTSLGRGTARVPHQSTHTKSLLVVFTSKASHYLHQFICRGSSLGLEPTTLSIHDFTEKSSGSLAKGQNPQVPLLGLGSSNLPLTAPPLISPFLPLHPPGQLQASLPMGPEAPAMVPSFSTSPSSPPESDIEHSSAQTLLSTPDWSPYVQN